MKKRLFFIMFAALFAVGMISSSATADVSPWFVEEVENNEAILSPGTSWFRALSRGCCAGAPA